MDKTTTPLAGEMINILWFSVNNNFCVSNAFIFIVQCFRHLATSGVLDVLILVVACVIVLIVILDMSKLQSCRTHLLQVSFVSR